MSRISALFFIIVAIFFIGACKGKTGPAKTETAKAAPKPVLQATEEKPKIEDEIFIYDKGGKRDPFFSLLIKAQEPAKTGATPLESYDASAIKVIGIVGTDRGNFAEIVLPDGKSYTVKEGMTVGVHNGRIQSVKRNSIIVEEMVKDYKGTIKSKKTILKLRAEEEE